MTIEALGGIDLADLQIISYIVATSQDVTFKCQRLSSILTMGDNVISWYELWQCERQSTLGILDYSLSPPPPPSTRDDVIMESNGPQDVNFSARR